MRSIDATNAAYGALPLANPKPDIRVILATPRGFCAGVRRAIDAVQDALAKHGPPVFVRRAAERFADEWDQKAFDPDYDTLPLEHFEPLVRKVFRRSEPSDPDREKIGV